MNYDEDSLDKLPDFGGAGHIKLADAEDLNPQVDLPVVEPIPEEIDMATPDNLADVDAYFLVDETRVAYGEEIPAYRSASKVFAEYQSLVQNLENGESTIKIYSRQIQMSASELHSVSPISVAFDENVQRVDISSLMAETLENAGTHDNTETVDNTVALENNETPDNAIKNNPFENVSEEIESTSEEELSETERDRLATEFDDVVNDIVNKLGSGKVNENTPEQPDVLQSNQYEIPHNEQPEFAYQHQGAYTQQHQSAMMHGAPGQPVTNANSSKPDLMQGGAHVIEGVGSVLSGGMVLGGTLLREGGNLLKAFGGGINSFSSRRAAASAAPGEPVATTVAPDNTVGEEGVTQASSVTDHLLGELEAYGAEYHECIDAIWREPVMHTVRGKLDDIALARGISVDEVIQSLPHDPDLSDIYVEVQDALDTTPELRDAVERSTQAMDDWRDSYTAVSERHERTDNEDEREVLKTVLDESREKMEASAAESPVIDENGVTQFEKLREMIQVMMEKLKGFIASLTGRKEEQLSPSM